MRGIVSYAGYVPYNLLQRSAISDFFGGPPKTGTRAVASYDEDTTTLGFEAARLALRPLDAPAIDALWFATSTPAYLDKTNANAIHAGLRLDADVSTMDAGGAVRSGVGALRAAVSSNERVLVVAADIRTGLPNGVDESEGGDAAVALLVGDGGDGDAGPLLAEHLGGASATEEFLDRWREPGDIRSKAWEERFSETKYLPLGEQAWNDALKAAELTPEQVDRVVVTGQHSRAVKSLARRLGTAKESATDDLTRTLGNSGAAHPGLLLAAALDQAEPGQVIALVVLADGADVLLFRTTEALAAHRSARPVARQIDAGSDQLPYGKYLMWREMITVEPPRRPEPDRVSGSAAGRTADWKFGFVGSRDRESGALHLPPTRVSMKGGNVDDMEPTPMADVPATVVTYTVDRVSYSPSPPIVAAIIDFDGGGRFPSELTDVDASEVQIGDRVEMTFRRLFTSDGIHNYFWKARPIRD
jgi:3-hydroxy-3-methylglutaryl CoA synthase/uncharacterized OB-fold protein